MPIVYKKDVLAALKEAGYSTYKIRQDRIFGQATLQAIRTGELVSWENMAKLCQLLKCQPGDILEYQDAQSGPRAAAERTEEPSA